MSDPTFYDAVEVCGNCGQNYGAHIGHGLAHRQCPPVGAAPAGTPGDPTGRLVTALRALRDAYGRPVLFNAEITEALQAVESERAALTAGREPTSEAPPTGDAA